MNTGTDHSCIVCCESCTLHCPTCKSAYYCSRKCQKNDWSTHKLFCAAYASFSLSSRPSSQHLRACFFPADSDRPEMVWVPWKLHKDEDGQYCLPEFDPTLGLDRSLVIRRNATLNRNLSNTLNVYHRDAFLIDGSASNKSILALLATKPEQQHDWRGPIVAISCRGPALDPPEGRDIDIEDLRHISDYFLSYNAQDS
jgi:hypothetical protein